MIWVFWGLVVLFVALQAADVATTYNGLGKGAVEANPLPRTLIERFGPLPGLLLTKLVFLVPMAILLFGLWWRYPAMLTSIELLAMLAVVDAVYGWVVGNNLLIIVNRIKANRT